MHQKNNYVPVPQIAIYDEHNLFKSLLHDKLFKTGYAVAFSCSSAEELFVHLKPHHSLLLFNGDEVNEDPLSIIRNVRKIFPHLKILVYVTHDAITKKKIFLKAGTSHMVSCCTDLDDFMDALENILPVYKKPSLDVHSDSFHSDHQIFQHFQKNRKYLDILTCLGNGRTTKEIPDLKGIPFGTVKTYKKRMMDALNCKSASELIAKAKDHRVI